MVMDEFMAFGLSKPYEEGSIPIDHDAFGLSKPIRFRDRDHGSRDVRRQIVGCAAADLAWSRGPRTCLAGMAILAKHDFERRTR